MNHLRNKKAIYLNMVKAFGKANSLSQAEVTGYEEMFRRCRSQEEQHQVFEAMMNSVKRLDEGTDRYALLHRDDLLELD